MRIGISALSLVPGRIGGAETYLRNLLAHLVAIDSEDEISLWLNFLGHRTFANISNRRIRRLVSGGLALPGPEWIEWNLFRIMRRFRVLKYLPDPVPCSNSTGVDVIHFPLTIIDVKVEGIPIVTTIVDLQHEAFPQFFTVQELDWRRQTFGEALRRSTYIIAISDYTRQQLLERYSLPEDKVVTVWLGVEVGIFQCHYGARKTLQIGKAVSLPEQYLFYPANTWPHKNHYQLLEAMMILGSLGWADASLVLTGTEHRAHGDVMRRIHDLGLEHRVFWLGRVPDHDLVALYKGATMLVFPSLFEGFGLPVLEAMAAGCPVACSNTTALPEVVGDAALLFDPNDAESIAYAITRLLDDSELRQQLVERGRKRAAMFSWDETAKRTRHVYRRVQGCAESTRLVSDGKR